MVLTIVLLAAGTAYMMAVVQQYMAAAEMGVAAAYLMEMGSNGGKITTKEVFQKVYTHPHDAFAELAESLEYRMRV